VWVPRNPAEKRAPKKHSRCGAILFPKSGIRNTANLVPRDNCPHARSTASFIRKNCIDGQARLLREHIPRETLDASSKHLEIYENSWESIRVKSR